MKPTTSEPPCPACGGTPASLIEDCISTDLTPWWRYYAQKLNPFKRRQRMVPADDVKPLVIALHHIANRGGQYLDVAEKAYNDFIAKYPTVP